jgi:hypothetical protein
MIKGVGQGGSVEVLGIGSALEEVGKEVIGAIIDSRGPSVEAFPKWWPWGHGGGHGHGGKKPGGNGHGGGGSGHGPGHGSGTTDI